MKRLAAKSPWALLVAIAIAVGLAAGALAYWAGPGSGSATTVLADTQQLTFEPGTPTAELNPGGKTGVAIVARNPNSYFVRIGSVVLDTDEGEPFHSDLVNGGCDVSVLSFVAQDNDGAGWEVPPRVGSTDGTLAIDLPGAMKMSSAAASACQGATFTVHLKGRP